MRRFSSRHNSPVVAHPLMQHTLSSQPASPVPHTPGSAAAMSAAAISPLTAAFAAAAGAASGLAAARGGSPGGGGSDGSATPLRRMGSISRAGSFGPDPSPLQSSSNSLREVRDWHIASGAANACLRCRQPRRPADSRMTLAARSLLGGQFARTLSARSFSGTLTLLSPCATAQLLTATLAAAVIHLPPVAVDVDDLGRRRLTDGRGRSRCGVPARRARAVPARTAAARRAPAARLPDGRRDGRGAAAASVARRRPQSGVRNELAVWLPAVHLPCTMLHQS